MSGESIVEILFIIWTQVISILSFFPLLLQVSRNMEDLNVLIHRLVILSIYFSRDRSRFFLHWSCHVLIHIDCLIASLADW